ncbi:MAG TPA: hypothetical protein PKE58_21945 [Acidobacteriota bacterium]|nr:hypothetical protein [Acidobacteriota bacterium]
MSFELSQSRINLETPQAQALFDALQGVYGNGAVILCCLKSTEISSLMNNSWLSVPELVISQFLKSQTVKQAVPELKVDDELMLPALHPLNSYELEGSLTQILINGGAYTQWESSEDEARSLTRNFLNLVAAEKYRSHVSGIRFYSAWTDWFYDVAWDSTFVIYNAATQKWWLLCTTDTD